jgi:hypothetical protein
MGSSENEGIHESHNSFLDSFMAGGWISGAAYIALYATFAAEVGESYIIDVQHWRHYFLIMGGAVGPRHCRRRAPQGRTLRHLCIEPFPAQTGLRGEQGRFRRGR